MEKKKIIAVQLCESIDLKSFIQNFSGKLPTIDYREFFFQNESQQVVYILTMGWSVSLDIRRRKGPV